MQKLVGEDERSMDWTDLGRVIWRPERGVLLSVRVVSTFCNNKLV